MSELMAFPKEENLVFGYKIFFEGGCLGLPKAMQQAAKPTPTKAAKQTTTLYENPHRHASPSLISICI